MSAGYYTQLEKMNKLKKYLDERTGPDTFLTALNCKILTEQGLVLLTLTSYT